MMTCKQYIFHITSGQTQEAGISPETTRSFLPSSKTIGKTLLIPISP